MTKGKRGRPKKPPENVKKIHLDLRIEEREKQAFKASSQIAGLSLSAWIRTRLREASRNELEENGMPVPFLTGQVKKKRTK